MELPPEESRQKIAITGASGFVGTRVTERIVREGHKAICLTRNLQRQHLKCTELRPYKIEDGLDFSGVDTVVHLAGESVFGLWTAKKMERIMSSRCDGTRAVVKAIKAARQKAREGRPGAHAGPQTLICASATGFYGDTGETAVDESAPGGKGFLADVVRAWEAEAHRAAEDGVRVVILRFGIILGREGGMLAKLRPLFMIGLGASMGSGKQWVSWVHVGDVAQFILDCATRREFEGVYNVVSPHPLRNAEFTQALAKKWGRKVHLHIPEFVVKKLFGSMSTMLLSSNRVLPKRLEENGFEFHYPEL